MDQKPSSSTTLTNAELSTLQGLALNLFEIRDQILNKNKQRAQPTNIAVQSQTAATNLSPQDEEYLADTSEESTVPYVGSDRVLTDKKGKGKRRKIQVKGKQRVKTKKKI